MTQRYGYLDTCALMRNAQGEVEGAPERDKTGRSNFRAILDDASAVLATSEIGVVEFYDAIGKTTRGPDGMYDDEWRRRSISELMGWIGDGRLVIVPVPAKAVESALVLMTISHDGPRMAFNAWDAVHLVAACSWATSLGVPVDFITCDSDFTRFFARFPHFEELVNVVMVWEK